VIAAAPSRWADDGLEPLRDHVRSALAMARVLLDEVLDARFRDEDPAGYRKLASKAGGELAMLLRLARRALVDDAPASATPRPAPDHHGSDDAAEIRALAVALAPHARGSHVTRSLLLRPSRAPMHALAHLCLTELGVEDAALDRLARRALASSVRAANERVPYRLLDAAWTRHLAFGDGELAHPALPLSPLGAGVDLLEATTEDAYAFSHALPYATDFGRVALPPHVDRAMLLATAEALAVQALDEDDLDLLAELLMAPAILRLPWTPTLTFAWHVLARVWRELGFVPGPGLPPAPADEPRAHAVRRVVGTTYHTTFAAGLCCATLVACAAPPPELPRGAPGDRPVPPGHGTAWQPVWRALPRAAQAALPFLELGFAVRRAVATFDLARLRDLLGAAARADLVDHPLFVQALELLERAHA
jgi:hypothetical protein